MNQTRGDAREVALQLPLGLALASAGNAEYLLLVFLDSPHPMHPNPQFLLSKKAPHMQSNSFQFSTEKNTQRHLRYKCHEKGAAQSEATKRSLSSCLSGRTLAFKGSSNSDA